ncbi:MAG: type 4a pilus biogenesis protein PilO [Methylotenera sp.]|uniref:type 4a pilus biogenesis protein PilO n=1 Tax=Methylotenera sp. TaxID=2051956 RepID=UPI00271FE69B|nr:type 4a pilus biogenesis protein PilO [Methylotenera sp.]MDO9393103.1 type 4a pilus biogenesis protein PilO [Methylotenera sp.]
MIKILTKSMSQALGKLNPHLVFGLMLFFVLLLAFEGWILLLRKPYAEYQQILSTRESLTASLRQMPDQSSELGRIAAELKQLSDKLSGELRLPASDDKMAASLMEALDQSAGLHSVTLASLKPKERKQVSVFEEVSFEVSAKGSYLRLCAWMLDFEKTLGNSATVTEFDMKTADEGKQVTLSMNIALYRPLRLNEVGK